MDRTLRTLTEFVQSITVDEIPEPVMARSRDILVDTLGCALGGRDCAAGRASMSFFSLNGGAGDGMVIGVDQRVPTDLAAFWNTAMIRYLDFNDAGPAGGHPSDMLGAHIALSGRTKPSGKQMLAAVVVGHEVYNRVANRVLFDDRRLDAGYGVALGAVAAGCHLLGLGPDATQHALSMAAVSSVPLRATRSGQLSDLKGFATALSARDAVFYLHLAEEGLTGPSSPFEGRHGIVELLQGEAGPLDIGDFSEWQTLGARLKYWPAAYNTHPAIWAGIELRKIVQPGRVKRVTLGVNNRAWHESGSEPEKWDPQTRETADHSIPYLFARALLDGTINQSSYELAAISEPAVRDLVQKISVIVDPEMAAQRPRLVLGCRAEVEDFDGQLYQVHIDGLPGHESRPLSKDEIASKFEALVHPVLGAATNDAFEAAWNVEEAESFEDVLRTFVPRERQTNRVG